MIHDKMMQHVHIFVQATTMSRMWMRYHWLVYGWETLGSSLAPHLIGNMNTHSSLAPSEPLDRWEINMHWHTSTGYIISLYFPLIKRDWKLPKWRRPAGKFNKANGQFSGKWCWFHLDVVVSKQKMVVVWYRYMISWETIGIYCDMCFIPRQGTRKEKCCSR